ncbi:Uncharacterised protein [Salmonella enterica subsp. enterica serovar Typhi]|nr:Uncharacterised protein [Salmonella enterica subsp. enterica serovar Typhi]CGW64300.1 Uncharacterised protein [Salmonella enterica subsp. enterica serovar Typhi]CHB85662.1 Uncharacterised protein [Salmonella enterica subsp. enterica serovar Typhi]CHG57631.1 Uncharacterised protein [Salmonella enterica subsp. enterica serovar Typhi]CIL99662.1 Uncharacterised protein [Salmonella enterica subsp. enterica serovar Typhi]
MGLIHPTFTTAGYNPSPCASNISPRSDRTITDQTYAKIPILASHITGRNSADAIQVISSHINSCVHLVQIRTTIDLKTIQPVPVFTRP